MSQAHDKVKLLQNLYFQCKAFFFYLFKKGIILDTGCLEIIVYFSFFPLIFTKYFFISIRI